MTDIDAMEAQVANLERENRELRMTLRDQFAMRIAGGFVGIPAEIVQPWDEWIHDIAQQSYEIADALIEARKGGAA